MIRASSVITLTEGVTVDAHDYRASTLRRIAESGREDHADPLTSEGLLVALHSEFGR